jgi:formate dehydrogenase (coenzyme F420) beta subunit
MVVTTTHWMKKTHGDPIGSLQGLLADIWVRAGLDGMLVPNQKLLEGGTEPRLLHSPDGLKGVNPFKPLMTVNAASLIPVYLRNYPDQKLAAVLRPCEMRALIEMAKHDGFDPERVLTIAVDCLGTFPPDEYAWRAERKGSSEKLSQDSLRFARQGGIQAYRYRPACQFCVAPDAQGADINIGVLGLPVRQLLTVTVANGWSAERIDWQGITDGLAEETILAQREKLVARLSLRHRRTRERVLAGLSSSLPQDVDALIEQFEGCGACQMCMQACPICSVDFPRPGEDQKYLRQDVLRWLVSCAGCGMCEQACPKSQPLSAVFARIQDELTRVLDYSPGASLEDSLPVH